MENRPGMHKVEEERNFIVDARKGISRKRRQFERKWEELEPRKKVILLTGAAAMAASSCFGLTYFTGKFVDQDREGISGDEESEPEINPWTPPAPTPTPTPTATPEPTRELQKDDCGVINNPSREGFDPSLPVRRNAFRVILHDIGDPEKVEEGPFEHTDRYGKTHTHQSMWEVEPPPAGEWVHNGDKICIKREGVSMPESFLPSSKRVSLRENMVDHNAKVAQRLSQNIVINKNPSPDINR